MNDYIICFWDKSKIRVTDKIGESLKQAIHAGMISYFELEQSLYAVKSVEKIIPVEEAYKSYPEENEKFQRMDVKQSNEDILKIESDEQKQIS